jgi:hypothetical protein
MNKMTKLAVTSAAVAGLAFGAVGCETEASDGFKQQCKDAGGEVKRESEVLGMSAVAFVVKGGGRGSTRGGTRSSTSGGGSWFSSSDDDDWVCAKDGVTLFEES